MLGSRYVVPPAVRKDEVPDLDGHPPGVGAAADLSSARAAAVLRNQAKLFGPVASDPTAWRVLSDVDGAALVRLREARAQARELAWAQAIETRSALPASTAAGLAVPGIVLDLDAS